MIFSICISVNKGSYGWGLEIREPEPETGGRDRKIVGLIASFVGLNLKLRV
jgi:hypothetical protein